MVPPRHPNTQTTGRRAPPLCGRPVPRSSLNRRIRQLFDDLVSCFCRTRFISIKSNLFTANSVLRLDRIWSSDFEWWCRVTTERHRWRRCLMRRKRNWHRAGTCQIRNKPVTQRSNVRHQCGRVCRQYRTCTAVPSTAEPKFPSAAFRLLLRSRQARIRRVGTNGGDEGDGVA